MAWAGHVAQSRLDMWLLRFQPRFAARTAWPARSWSEVGNWRAT